MDGIGVPWPRDSTKRVKIGSKWANSRVWDDCNAFFFFFTKKFACIANGSIKDLSKFEKTIN